jgi:translation initiation factor IF-3
LAIAQEREARINGEITAREIRLVGMEGEQIGVVSLREAMALAEENDVDLVEISRPLSPRSAS